MFLIIVVYTYCYFTLTCKYCDRTNVTSTSASTDWISSLPTRSAIVRASLRMRWQARRQIELGHHRDQWKVRREGQRSFGAADGDNFVLHRLAHHLQDARPELRDFIREQDTSVSHEFYTQTEAPLISCGSFYYSSG